MCQSYLFRLWFHLFSFESLQKWAHPKDQGPLQFFVQCQQEGRRLKTPRWFQFHRENFEHLYKRNRITFTTNWKDRGCITSTSEVYDWDERSTLHSSGHVSVYLRRTNSIDRIYIPQLLDRLKKPIAVYCQPLCSKFQDWRKFFLGQTRGLSYYIKTWF